MCIFLDWLDELATHVLAEPKEKRKPRDWPYFYRVLDCLALVTSVFVRELGLAAFRLAVQLFLWCVSAIRLNLHDWQGRYLWCQNKPSKQSPEWPAWLKNKMSGMVKPRLLYWLLCHWQAVGYGRERSWPLYFLASILESVSGFPSSAYWFDHVWCTGVSVANW